MCFTWYCLTCQLQLFTAVSTKIAGHAYRNGYLDSSRLVEIRYLSRLKIEYPFDVSKFYQSILCQCFFLCNVINRENLRATIPMFFMG